MKVDITMDRSVKQRHVQKIIIADDVPIELHYRGKVYDMEKILNYLIEKIAYDDWMKREREQNRYCD